MSIWDDRLIGDRSHDLQDDPLDVTAHMNADHELRANMQRLGYVKYWSLTNRWRLTPDGERAMAQRKEAARLARQQGVTRYMSKEHDDETSN